jgi:hypothetical protein
VVSQVLKCHKSLFVYGQLRLDCLGMTTRLQWPHFSLSISSGSIQVMLQLSLVLGVPADPMVSVPSTTHYLILSPFIPKYTIHNSFLNVSTTVTTVNYDAKSIQKTIPPGTPAYVQNVTINGQPSVSRCHFDFYDVFRVGGEVVITLTADKNAADDCQGKLPESISTGGFAQAR